MNIFPLISLFSTLICLSVGIFVYFNSRKSLVHKLFWALCLCNAYWGFIEFMTRQSGDVETAMFWVKVGAFVIFALPVVLHFVMVYTGMIKIIQRWWALLILYTPTLFYSLSVIFTDKIFSGVTKMYWGYTLNYTTSSLLRNSFFILFFFMGIVSIIISFRYYFRLNDKKEKKQAFFVALGCLAPIVLANITQGILTTLMHFPIPPMTVVAAAFQEIFIGFAIWRYDLFSLNPATAADNIVSAMSDMFILMKPNGRIVSINQAVTRVLGYKKEELYGVFASSIMPDVMIEYLLKQRQGENSIPDDGGTVYTRGINYMETELLTRNGSMITASISVSILIENDGNIAGFVVIARDISEKMHGEKMLHEAIEMAEAANHSKSEFLARMSHEIRTPLNGILGMTELTLGTSITKEQREYLEIVRSSGETLLAIINDILDFSKIEAQKMDLEKIEFNLVHTLDDVIDLMSLRASKSALVLDYFINPGVPTALIGDPVRIRQVIINLVDNAIKFTKEGEVFLQVEAETEEDTYVILHFSISDTGIGIPPDRLDQIFESFQQADGSISREYGGTGLGLAICRQLVHLMGGDIWPESEQGRGSTFHFTAPFLKSRGDSIDISALDRVDFSGKRILIVDDNNTNLFVLREMTSMWGINPTEASNGKDALAEIDRAHNNGTPFQVVLLDMVMPLMDGFEVAAQLRERPYCRELKIVLITSIGSEGHAARCRELGISGYLMKPIKQSDLLDILKIIIASHPGGTSPLITRHTVSELRSRLNVLLAEDNLVNQKLAVALLEKRGHHVTVALDGNEAVDAVEKNRFDIILMDVEMPRMNGIQATRIIREKEKGMGQYVPIVALTAHALRGDKERFLEAGMDGYVSKPIQVAELFAVIDELVHLGGSGKKNNLS